jgi:hypothetical protein
MPLLRRLAAQRAPSQPRLMPSAALISAACIAAWAPACSGDGAEPNGGTGGTEAAGGAACLLRGVGQLEIRITGLPDGVEGSMVVGGPVEAIGVSSNRTLDVSAGLYVFTPERVAAPDPIVRTLFDPVLEQTELCLGVGERRVVELAYEPVPTSHQLWTIASSGDGNLLGFAASGLVATADLEPTLSVVAGAGKDVVFDKQGNLWSLGGTPADPHLLRFPLSAFDDSGEQAPDRRIDIAGLGCMPAVRALAFDRGSLWVSTCGSGVVALSSDELALTGEVTPSIVVGGTSENGDVAFDSSRNLWVAARSSLLRYDAERLETSIDAPDLTLATSDADGRALTPDNLAFDAAGNLWLVDSGSNVVAQIASADLGGTGERSVTSSVRITLGVAALLERPAFDESGGLWLALDQNRFGRLSPAQLAVSTGAGAPTTPETRITSPGMGNAHRIAFYPAPEALPLYHRFP